MMEGASRSTPRDPRAMIAVTCSDFLHYVLLRISFGYNDC
jgi:hypothetical protein